MRRRRGFALLTGFIVLLVALMYLTGISLKISMEEAEKERARMFERDFRVLMSEATDRYRVYARDLSEVERMVRLGQPPTGTALSSVRNFDPENAPFDLSSGLSIIPDAVSSDVSGKVRIRRDIVESDDVTVVVADTVSAYDISFSFELPNEFDNDEMKNTQRKMATLGHVVLFEPDYTGRKTIRVVLSFGRETGSWLPLMSR